MNGAVPMLAIDGPDGAGKGTVAGCSPGAWAGTCWIPGRFIGCWRSPRSTMVST